MTALVRGFIDRETQVNLACFALRRDPECLFVVERQAELACEHVCGATRNDSEARVCACQALYHLVDCAVPTRDNHVGGAITRHTIRDLCCVAGAAR